MYRQEFYIVAKKDENIDSPNYHRLISLRSDHTGSISSESDKWTDNIFLAKHFKNERDAVSFASKQLNDNFIPIKNPNKPNYIKTDYKIVKVFFDIEGNSITTSLLCKYDKENL